MTTTMRGGALVFGHEIAGAPMVRDEITRLLNQIGILNHVCDLDLLVFFARHPRSLVSGDSLAGLLGWDLKEIGDSLEVLVSAGLLTRTPTPAPEACLYVFAVNATTDGPTGEWLSRLMAFASTREGRLVLVQALTRRRLVAGGSRSSAIAPAAKPASGSPAPRSAGDGDG